MPRFRLSGRRFWSNRRRRRSSTNTEPQESGQNDAVESTSAQSQEESTSSNMPEAILSEPAINSTTPNNDTTNNIQRASTDPPPITSSIDDDDDTAVMILTATPPPTQQPQSSLQRQPAHTTSSNTTTPIVNHPHATLEEEIPGDHYNSSNTAPITSTALATNNDTSQQTLTTNNNNNNNNNNNEQHDGTIPQRSFRMMMPQQNPTAAESGTFRRRAYTNDSPTTVAIRSPPNSPVTGNGGIRHVPSDALVRPSQGTTEFTFPDQTPTQSSTTLTEVVSGRVEANSSSSSTVEDGRRSLAVVTVLLRETEGVAHYSRLLGATVRSPMVHTPRRYHFIWSSDGTDTHLWSSPIRLRSYLSQFCTAMSRRVIPYGASIEVVLYPNLLLANTVAPGFVPMSITRLYCMIHPIHPPTSWQTQFPADFAGNWSNFISDVGMNALAGPFLEAPIPTSLPDPVMPAPSPPTTSIYPPLAADPGVDMSDDIIMTETPPPVMPPHHYSDSSLSLPLSTEPSSHSLPRTRSTVSSTSSYEDFEEDDDGTSLNSSTPPSLPSPPPPPQRPLSSHPLPTSTSLEGAGSSNLERNIPFRFPFLPNRGLHEYNLFVPPSYVLGPVIGEGEFAKVRMACNLVTNGAVAIKSFRKRRGGLTSSIDEQIVREINAIKGLRCRNIIKVFETLIHGDRVFMVMEIMTRGDLRKYINKSGAMRESNARKMFSDILNGVSYLHSNRIVHLDLKLENLLLNEELVIKITDFGCARFQVGNKRFNTPCGSYAYGAPEVISGQTYNGIPADIWSIGVILYCMVSARLPYSDDGQLAELIWERRQSPDIPSWVSSDCGRLIKSMLKYRPERRYSEVQVMTHSWMWAETRRLPWCKPHPQTKRRKQSTQL